MQFYNNNRIPPDNNEGLAIAYVKPQSMQNRTYDLKTALQKGTIYPCLDKPFLGKGVCNK